MTEMQSGTFSAETAFEEKAPASFSTRLVRQTALVVVGSALVAACAHISVPLLFTPVPLTLQNFAVLLLGLLMEPAAVFASMVLYLVEGASGMPVFTPHGLGGVLQLAGPSGGFLLAYPFIAVFASLLTKRIRPATFGSYAFTAALASVLLYLCGSAWFTVLTHAPAATTFKLAVLPFVAGDALKIFAAASIAASITKFRRRGFSGEAGQTFPL